VSPPKTRRRPICTDVGIADIASLHGCNLLGQRRSGCRGAYICHTWGLEPRILAGYGLWRWHTIHASHSYGTAVTF